MTKVKFCNMHLRLPFVLLALIEVMVCTAAVFIAARLRYWETGLLELESPELPWLTVGLFGLVIPTCVMAMGVYRSHFRGALRMVLARTLAGFAVGGVVLAILYYIFPPLYLGRGVFGLALVVAFVTMALIRSLFAVGLERERLKLRVLVLGAGKRADSIERRLRRRSDRRGLQVVGYVPLTREDDRVAVAPAQLLELGNLPLADYCRLSAIDEIVTARDEDDPELPYEDLLEARFSGVRVIDIVAFHEREQGRLPLDLLRPDSLLYIDGFEFGRSRDFARRLFDLMASVVVLVVAWPLILLAALAIRLEDGRGAPILYRQTRVGLFGEPFEILKFRTMRPDAEANGVATWACRDDPRITRVGRVLRKTRVDELPQLLNVLYGDMSIIGPRPERPQFVVELDTVIPHYATRHAVKPGITGWAQISYPYGASFGDALNKQEYDLFYVKNRSLVLDTLILLHTAEVVLFKRAQAR